MSLTWFMACLVLALRELPATPGAAAGWPTAWWGCKLLVALPLQPGVRQQPAHPGRAAPRPTRPATPPSWRPALLGQVAGVYLPAAPANCRPPTGWLSLGLPPAVAQLNGFYTLDSNQNQLPAALQARFPARSSPVSWPKARPWPRTSMPGATVATSCRPSWGATI